MRRYRAWEILTVLLCLLIFLGSLGLYAGDISLRKYLLGWEDGDMELIGTLGKKDGKVLRQAFTQPEFRKIETKDELYNLDTVVTGNNGGATIELQDGSVLELGPRTMVKLDFATLLALDGIQRKTTVTVISGQAKKQNPTNPRLIIRQPQKKVLTRPTPPPLPKKAEEVPEKSAVIAPVKVPETKARLLKPANRARFKVRDFASVAKLEVPIEFKVGRLNTSVKLSVKKKSTGKQLFARVVKTRNGLGRARAILDQPGLYVWTIEPINKDEFDPKVEKRTFSVDRKFRQMRVLDPLIGGKKGVSNRLNSNRVTQKFDITLRWKETKRKRYEILFFQGEKSPRAVLRKKSATSAYKLNKNKIFAGQIFYEVQSPGPRGFTLTTGKVPFRFDFLPPRPVFPLEGSKISKQQLQEEDNKVLFTWEKTNFTKSYQIEIGLDPDFKQSLLRQKTRENFFILENPRPGKYYWRLKSFGKGAESSPSAPTYFEIGNG